MSHTEEKNRTSAYKLGAVLRLCVTAPNYYSGPTILVGPPLTSLPHGAPHGRPRGPRNHVASCHVAAPPCASCAPCGPPGLCHVASVPCRTPRRSRTPRQPLAWAHSPRQPAGNNPFFAIFLIRNSIYKSNKNRKKCIKLQKFIFLKIQLLLISNFLHWIINFFFFNIMPFKIYLERRNQDDL